MKNILLAIDFDGDIQKLLQATAAIASGFGSKVWVMHVAAPEPDFVGYDPGPQAERDHVANELRKEHVLVQQIAEQLMAQGIAAEGLLVQGPTVETMLAEAEKLKIDLLAIGFREHGFFHKIVLGNTTLEVVRKSGVPLLVVPVG